MTFDDIDAAQTLIERWKETSNLLAAIARGASLKFTMNETEKAEVIVNFDASEAASILAGRLSTINALLAKLGIYAPAATTPAAAK